MSLSCARTAAMLIVGLIATASHAQVYKWVDERGMTHYSNNPPAETSRMKTEAVEQKISVYTPEKATAGGTDRRQVEKLADQVDRLEQQLAAERQARASAATAEADARRVAYDRCLAQRRVDCDDAVGPVVQPVFIAGRPRRTLPNVMPPNVDLRGVTAGNVSLAIRQAGGRSIDTPGAGGLDTATAVTPPATARLRVSSHR